MKKFSNIKFLASLSGLLVTACAVFALGGTTTAHAAIDNTPDCDNVAIIKCGAFSESALRAAYDKNEYGDLSRVYSEFGIKRSDMTGMKSGIVYRNGNVTVDGKIVATNAMTAGRNYGGTPIPNTKNAGKYSVSKFVTEGQTAFVKLDKDGKFLFAIVKPCGNPVTATPKAPPAPPKPPKEEPKPVHECKDLSAKRISRTEYRFTATAAADNGAKVTNYVFDFGDGNTQTSTSRTVNHTYAQAGDYTIKVSVRFEVDGKTKTITDNDCVVKIKVSPPPAPEKTEVCNPKTGETITVDKKDADKYKPVGDKACEDIKVCLIEKKEIITIKESEFDSSIHSRDLADCEETPQEIPSTGPESFVLGGLGLGSLTAAGAYLRSSRRNLIEKLMNR